MSCNWIRRALLLACASLVLLAGCGAGTIESQLNPSRIVVFGDGMSDLGQSGSRYTVNDGSFNIWTLQLAASFGLPLSTASSGGTSYATGNARVTGKPDAAGNSATPTVQEQVTTFLATGPIGANDLLVVNAGTSDIITEMAKVTSAAQTSSQMIANAGQAGRDLAAQVRRLVDTGASHVMVVGPFHLGKTPWATAIGQADLLTQASGKFNEELLVSLVDLGAKVLYVDAAFFFNIMVASPVSYSLTNSIDPVCTSVDPGPGIGIGAGQINSALCTTATLLTGADQNLYMFADRVYLGPQAHRKFGENAYTKIRSRW